MKPATTGVKQNDRMAGYSGTELWKKLGIKEGARVLVVDGPADFRELLQGMPDSVAIRDQPKGEFEVIVLFCKNLEGLADAFTKLTPCLVDRGGFWVAWPKKASKLYVEGLTENPVRDIGLAAGLVDNKVCAIDDDWSGLRFVRRLQREP